MPNFAKSSSKTVERAYFLLPSGIVERELEVRDASEACLDGLVLGVFNPNPWLLLGEYGEVGVAPEACSNAKLYEVLRLGVDFVFKIVFAKVGFMGDLLGVEILVVDICTARQKYCLLQISFSGISTFNQSNLSLNSR